MGDKRRAERDGEAGVSPLLESCRHRRKQQYYTEELGPREFHPEVVGKAEVRERLRHLRQAQLRIRHIHLVLLVTMTERDGGM